MDVIRLSLTSTMILTLALPSFAQVNKFKSQSRFNPGGAKKDKPSDANKKTQFTDDKNNKAAFGNRTEKIPDLPSSKYVQLNPETAFGPEIVENFDFPDTDILELTKHMQQLTGINLILDKEVKGKVSISAPTPITVGDAWKAYLAALNMAGYSLVKAGAFYKIVNARDVRYVPTKIYTGSYTPETDTHIMKVLPLRHVDAAEISRNFRPFMTRYGRIIDLKQTNTLIIQDTGANITRLVTLLKFIDVPGFEETLQIIKVKNSSASEIAKLLDEILKSGSSSRSSSRSSSSRTGSKRFSSGSSSGGSQNISKIIAEPRTNSIIAMANADGARELRALISKLDVKYGSTNSDKIHVHYLNYGSAEELATTLSALVSGSSSAAAGGSSSTSARNFSRGGAGANGGSTLFNGEVKITADKNNNALVVTATPTDWITIKSVISKLDIPRDQVYVEGLIIETTATRQREIGVEYLGAYGNGAASRGGFSNSGSLANVIAGTAPTGFFLGGTVGGTRTVPGPGGTGTVTLNPLNALIAAVASNVNNNVLATPQILAIDNTEAEFEVGETEPIRNSTVANNQTQNTAGEQEAKLSLKITPQINKVTRFVKLKINQQINDFSGPSRSDGTGRPTTTRAAITEVIVRDKDTIAMGGLLRDRQSTSFDKVPLLGDIPVLGWLFKSKRNTIQKVNLLMFMTPTILSPYSQTASVNSLKVLDNRIDDLQNIIDEENPEPNKKAADKLRAKLERQTGGPLFDTELNEYQKTNRDIEGIGNPTSDATLPKTYKPDYQGIVDEINRKKANKK